jgi:small subunit ribosomal protein SAe
MSQLPTVLNAREEDIQKMLACQVHIGSRNLEPSMERYIWKRRSDGVYLIDLQKTWEKLVLAARIIATIENPADICVVSSREFGQRAVLKFAKYTGAQALAGRWTPGTLTNQIQDKFMEPRILILTDPRTDSQPIREASYVNIPTIAFAHTDSSLSFIDVAIPCNNKGKHAIGLMWWLLTREVLLLKNTPGLIRGQPWDVMVDLFLYRAPEEQEKEETAQIEGAFQGEGQEWTQQATGEQWEGQDWGKTGGEWGAAPAEGQWDPKVVGSSWDAQQE